MATVPETQGQRIAPAGPDAPSIRVGNVPGAFGEGIGQSLSRLGAEGNELANVMTQHAVAMQTIQNNADADDRAVRFATGGNEIATDFTVNQRGGNALPSLPEYVEKLNKARDDAGEGLNPVAKKLFESNSRRLQANLMGSMSRHAAEQNREYTVQTSTSAMDTARNLAVAHADDPAFLETARQTIIKNGEFLAHYLGLGDVVGEDKISEQLSKLYSEVIVQKANDNPIEAAKFFEDHKEEMKGEDISRTDTFLKGRTEPYVARAGADAVANGEYGTGVVAEIKGNAKAFFERILGVPVLVTSEVRTEADQERLRKAGYKPSPTSEHMEKYGYADDIVPIGMSIAEAKKKIAAADLGQHQILNEGNHLHVGFKKDSPAFSARGPSINQAQTLLQLEGLMASGMAAIDARVDKLYGGDPHIKAMMETEFASIYNRRKAVLTAVTAEARDNVIAAVTGDPEHPPTSLEQLQQQTGFASSWQYLSSGQQRGVLNMLKANANPPVSQLTAGQLEARDILDGESKANPAKFAQRDPLTDPLYTQLPNSYRIAFMDRRNTIAAGKAVDSMANTALSQVGPLIKGTDVENTADNADNYNKFASRLSDEVKSFYDIHKKPPSQIEVRKMAQELLLDKATWGGEVHTLRGRAFEVENFVPAWFVSEALARDKTLTPGEIATIYQRRTARAR